MILVDTTVWVDYFNGIENRQTFLLDRLLEEELILVGDLILCEVLQGFRDDAEFEAARQSMMDFEIVNMLNPKLALKSAMNYRWLRKSGITIRRTIDCLIATYCIENDISLLHNDRDFDPIEKHLGLRGVHRV